jgi:hypothetical protein
LPGRQWNIYIPENIINELLCGYNGSKIVFPLDDSLFTELYIFSLDVLDSYYKKFQESSLYEELKDEVSRQEILYEILRRYSMISN